MSTNKFKIGDYVRVRPNTVYFIDPSVTYTVEDVTNNGTLIKLKGIAGLLMPNNFILTTGKHDVPQKTLTYDEVVGQDLEVDIAQSWDFPIFPMPEPLGKCECGSDAINAGSHSNWCPAHQK